MYHSAFSRAMGGAKNTYSKAAGAKNVQNVLAALQSTDSSATIES